MHACALSYRPKADRLGPRHRSHLSPRVLTWCTIYPAPCTLHTPSFHTHRAISVVFSGAINALPAPAPLAIACSEPSLFLVVGRYVKTRTPFQLIPLSLPLGLPLAIVGYPVLVDADVSVVSVVFHAVGSG